MMTALASGILPGTLLRPRPRPLLALVLAQTLRHGAREGCKIALTPLVGSKVLVVLLTARSRDLLAGRPNRVVMCVLDVLLAFFALLLFREGWKHLAGTLTAS
jgi:threonine/homoserine/homoserine lactone efflux protein